MMSPFFIAAIGLFGVMGTLTVGVGLANLRKWWTMRQLDPSGSTAADGGVQEFEGRARAIDEPITAPITDTESVICNHRVELYVGSSEGDNWHTVEKSERKVQFEVEGSGSTVAVDPENATELISDKLHVDFAKTDEIPDAVSTYIEEELDDGGIRKTAWVRSRWIRPTGIGSSSNDSTRVKRCTCWTPLGAISRQSPRRRARRR